MKKILLILLIVILLGGCGLGGWYFLTRQSANKGINIKLEVTDEYLVSWNPTITEEEKAEYMWAGATNDEMFIFYFCEEMTPERIKGDRIELNEDFTGKECKSNSNEFSPIYYTFNNSRTEIKMFYDESYLYPPYSNITTIDGEYWYVYYCQSEVNNPSRVIYRFLIKLEEVK